MRHYEERKEKCDENTKDDRLSQRRGCCKPWLEAQCFEELKKKLSVRVCEEVL